MKYCYTLLYGVYMEVVNVEGCKLLLYEFSSLGIL